MYDLGDFFKSIYFFIKLLIGFWWWSPEEDLERFKESSIPKPLKVLIVIFFSLLFLFFFGMIVAFFVMIVLYDDDEKNLAIGILVVLGVYFNAFILKFVKVGLHEKKKKDDELYKHYNADQLVEMEQRKLYEEKYKKEHRVSRVLCILACIVIYALAIVGAIVIIKRKVNSSINGSGFETKHNKMTESPAFDFYPVVSANNEYKVYLIDDMEYALDELDVNPQVATYIGGENIRLYFRLVPRIGQIETTVHVDAYDDKGVLCDSGEGVLLGSGPNRMCAIAVDMDLNPKQTYKYVVRFQNKTIDEPDADRCFRKYKKDKGHVYVTMEGEKYLNNDIFVFLYKNDELVCIAEDHYEGVETGIVEVDVEIGSVISNSYEVYQ